MNPLHIGFIGAGAMAQWQIYPSLHFADVVLTAVCDLDPARAQMVAAKFGAPRWYTDYRVMWANENLDALIIQMHPKPRQPIVLAALEAGYHVFMPKPPAVSLHHTIALSQAAKRHNRILMTNFQSRFSFGISEARRLMARPEFGQLTQIHCTFCSGAYEGERQRDYDNGIHAFFLDFTPHHLDLARYLGGEVEQLSLYYHEKNERIALAVSLAFQNGAVGTMQLNSQRIWWRNYDRIELTGEGEYIVVDSLWHVKHYTEAQNSFTENYRDQRSGELTGDGVALIEFATAVRQNRQPNANIYDVVETMRLYQHLYDARLAGKQGVIWQRPNSS